MEPSAKGTVVVVVMLKMARTDVDIDGDVPVFGVRGQ